ncbi:GNAT family N-acetyltransferase [Fulvivirga ulvae]|uniref:GNAT family N-acetyltransferase n=1 Tax=Fulvivirga ulvae TaxID=2904245 RepID=UPI001F3F13B9|nr:GNAT family N-acetyltransferase [Fulvivirga ulvae]UII30542.1 GNAT family N-acetyltransferase [Fulvivirga ulvae]
MTLQNFKIRQLSKNDVHLFKKLVELFREVFEDNQPQLTDAVQFNPLQRPDFIAYAILNEHEVIGGLTAYELANYYSGIPEIFIYDIAIKTAYQRKGLGKMLLREIMKYAGDQGAKEVFVMAHTEDQQAVDFYTKAGGKDEAVVSFTYKPVK